MYAQVSIFSILLYSFDKFNTKRVVYSSAHVLLLYLMGFS